MDATLFFFWTLVDLTEWIYVVYYDNNPACLGLGCADPHINKWCQLWGFYLSLIENLFKLHSCLSF